jgi:ketosteroid isomerase-like protein
MTSQSDVAGDAASAAAHMDRYLASFNAGEFDVTASCYHEPCTFIAANSVLVINTEAEVAQHFEGVVAGLRARGFDHSEWIDKQIIGLGDNLALASCTYQRLKADGNVLEAFCATYTLQKHADGWRIVSLVGHPTETQLRAAN